jgi:CRP/FNR family transcriptional regulator, cyclic AMP receptor protein
MAEEHEAAGPAVSLSLAGVKILRAVPDDECRRLETKCTYRRLAPGDVLMTRFTSGAAVYFILAGRARVVHFLDGQDEVTIATISVGEAIGEISAIDGGTASATVVAEEDCVIAELPKEEFQALLVRRGDVAVSLLKRWAAVIRDLDDKVSLVSSIGPEQRICSELVRLARVDRPGSDRWLVPELPSHQDLAIRAQTTREAVASTIAELASRGIVERRTRTLHILDYRGLQSMVRHGSSLPLPSVRIGGS